MGFTPTKLRLKFALPPFCHTPRRRSLGPPRLGVKAMGILGIGEDDDGAVVGGSVDETEEQDAGLLDLLSGYRFIPAIHQPVSG